LQDFNHFLIRNLSKIAIIETDCSEYRVILKTHYVVGLPPQFGKAVAWRHRHRKHEPLRIADASGAQSRAGRRARRNAVINHNRRAAGDLRAFAIAQVAVALPIDFGEFGIASGFKRSFVNTNVLNDVFIAHRDRAAAVDNRTHCQFRLEGHADLAHEDQIDRRLERLSNLRRDSNSTARQREDRRLLLLVSEGQPDATAARRSTANPARKSIHRLPRRS
jgi:hypothetical protein